MISLYKFPFRLTKLYLRIKMNMFFLGKINIQNIGKEAKMLVESAKKQMSLTSKATDQFGKMSASNRALLLYSLFSRYREICKQLYIRANLPKKGLLTFADN